MKIFVDNDVILDVLLDRKEFTHSRILFTLIENNQVKAYTSSTIFTNSFYIISKLQNKKKAWSALKKIRLLFKIGKVSQNTVDLALASDFNDFEDALQHYVALDQNTNYIITRNKRDYLEAQIPTLTPQEFIALKWGL